MSDAHWSILRYDVDDFPFRELVAAMIGVTDLSAIPAADGSRARRSDQDTEYHRNFYDHLELILPIYRDFVKALFRERCRDIYIQRIPTLRVHRPQSVAVERWHRDEEFGHDPQELNYWVPMTAAYETNTIWIENLPASAEYGEIVVFAGATVRHGNVVNETSRSRVSFDFRTVERDIYRPRSDRTVAAGLRFVVGEYWDVIE